MTTSGATEASSKAKICGDGTGMVQLQGASARAVGGLFKMGTKTIVSSMVRVSETLVCLMVNETRALTGLDVKPPTTIAAYV